MNNDKYLNYYIETMTATLTDCVIRNISLQANSKVTDEVIEEKEKTIEDLKNQLNKTTEDLKNQIEQKNNNTNETVNSLNKRIDNLHDENTRLNNQVSALNGIRSEYESVKNQVSHIDTFRNELLNSRKENEDIKSRYEKTISELNLKIEQLQLPPLKKKKIDVPSKMEESSIEIFALNEQDKDGGSF